MFEAETRSEQGLNEKNALQAMAIENFQRFWQGIVTVLRAPEHVAFEMAGEYCVEVVPAIAPDLNVNG